METILQILQWSIPSGGLGAAITWFVNRRLNQTRTKKEIHDTFKQMYEDVSALLLEVQNKNDELTVKVNEKTENETRLIRAVNRLSRAMEAIPLCDYHAQCPVLGELRLDEGGCTGGNETGGGIQPSEQRSASSGKRSGRRHPRNGKSKNPGVGDSEPAGGGRVQSPEREYPCDNQA